MKVTRDVISDLWPVYDSGEASADTKAMVEAFLAQDAAFAAALRAKLDIPSMEVPMSPESETRALKRTRDLVKGRGWLRGIRLFALLMSGFAFGKIIEDTTWTASPRGFIANAVMAVIAWIAYVALLERARRKSLGS
jgi:hypothetical protein